MCCWERLGWKHVQVTSSCPIFPRISPPFSTSIISPSIVSPIFSENFSFNHFQYFNSEPSVDGRNPKQPPERYTTLFIMGFQLPTSTGESIPDFWLSSTVFTKELLRVHLGCSSGGPCFGFCHCWSYHWFQRLRGGLTRFSNVNVMSTRKTPPGTITYPIKHHFLRWWIVLFKFGGICFLVPWNPRMFYTWIKCKEKTLCNCNKDISLRSGSHRMRPPQTLERMSGEELLWWLGQFGTQDCNWSSQRATSLAWPSLELRWCSHSIEQCATFSDFERNLKRPKNSWNLACAILFDIFILHVFARFNL